MPFLIKQTDKGAEVLASGSKNDCERAGAQAHAAGETAHLVVVTETAITFGGDYAANVARRKASREAQAKLTKEAKEANASKRAAEVARQAAESAQKEADRLNAKAKEAAAEARASSVKAQPEQAKKAAKKKAAPAKAS